MRNVLDKSSRENQNTVCDRKHFLENRAFCDVIWKNIVEPDSPQRTIRRMLITGWLPKATNKISECVTRTAFPLQQQLHKRTSMLRHTYIACRVLLSKRPTMP